MLVTTNEEMVSSLAAFQELRCEGRRVSFVEPGVKTIKVDLRVKEPHEHVYLARLVAHLGYEEIDFRGAHLWLTTWGVWNPQVEVIGRKTLEQFRRGQGENRPLESAPGHIFRDDEFTERCLLPAATDDCRVERLLRSSLGIRASRLFCGSQPRFVPGHRRTYAGNAREGIENLGRPQMDQDFTEG